MKRFEFDRDFMNAKLSLSIVCKSFSYARSVAEDAFRLVERIESDLSMYRDSSEVYAINIAKVDEEIRVTGFTLDCLELGDELFKRTLGAIDVCMGQHFLKAKSQANIKEPKRISLEIDKENFSAKKKSEGFLDFGAIGKGYAIDRVVELLKNTWLINNAFINFASSTIFALGCDENGKAWEVSLNGSSESFIIEDSYALASSGLNTQATHIIDPMTLECPKCDNSCCYSYIKDSACYADALSTAFSILSLGEIEELCREFSAKFLKK